MEISGKITQFMPEVTGEGKNGPWKKQDFILETQEQYPKKVCITVWGDKVNLKDFTEGEEITASINVESREYNGRWYTDVKAWRMSKSGAGEDSQPDFGTVPPEAEPPLATDDGPMDDLPF